VNETAAGRTVLGGGGITPDVVVENRTLSESMVRLFTVSAFFRFAVELLSDIPEERYAEFAADFAFDGDVAQDFWTWVVEEEILEPGIIESLRENPEESADVRRAVTAEVYNATLGLNEGYRKALEGDEQLQAAIDSLDTAEEFWEAYREEHSR
jgi:carboxyl-terminal processing protease